MINKFIYITIFFILLSCSDKNKDHNRNNSITKAIEIVSPSVVGIIVKSKHIDSEDGKEFGSGLAISNDGFIITNAHVVEFSNNIIVTGSADTNTIEGTNQIVLESSYASVQLYCNGATKFFIC